MITQQPNEPGLYYGRGEGFEHYNFYLIVTGTPPFLKITAYSRKLDKIIKDFDPSRLVEYYKVEEPEPLGLGRITMLKHI